LVSRVVLAEAEVEKLRAAVASIDEVADRAKTAAAATEAAAQDTTQFAAREKAMPQTKVADLECDLGTAAVDLATASRQFSQVTNQLQVVTEEATRLRESNVKLSKDLEGKSSRHFPSPSYLSFASLCVLTCFLMLQGCACITPG
jgi:predicted  nucleic acid-binding Zn-ribbon protein